MTGAPARTGVPRWAWPVALALLVVAVYAPSLGGGFFNWDDPWLVEHNSLLARGDAGVFHAIWLDWSRPTRMALGAEYLPIRDLSAWLDLHVFGLNPHPMRAVQLAIYVAGVLFTRAALHRTLADHRVAEVAAWVFALHPVHAESAAWLAGRKDVLALAFVGAALWVHAGRSRRRWLWVPLLLLAAHWSKAQSVIALGLLLATDLVGARRIDWRIYTGAAVVALMAAAIDVHVGHLVGMTTPPAGGTRWTAAATMGPVWLRYAWESVWPGALSAVHDVPVRTHWDWPAIAGWTGLAAWGGIGLWRWRRLHRPLVLGAWLWFVVPLIPVSQVLFPLENRMADRYLLWSVMAVALGVGVCSTLSIRAARAGLLFAAGSTAAYAGWSVYRGMLFADSVAAFREATTKTRSSLVAPYQLGQALEARGDDAGAMAAYEETLRRSNDAEEPARRATNNLAKLCARYGRLGAAERVLRAGLTHWPDDAKMIGNLATVLLREGRRREADALVKKLRDVRAAEHPPKNRHE